MQAVCRHMMGSVGPAPARYEHLDALRALAVMLVVVAHAGVGHIVPGGSGVTIFFVISGFIITHLVLREFDKSTGFSARGFYYRRFMKLFPPFLCVVLIPTVIYSFLAQINWSSVAGQVFFYFNWIYMKREDPLVLPGSGVVWSLSIEEQFYIVFALLWICALKSRHAVRVLAVTAAACTIWPLIVRILIVAGSGQPHFRVYYGTDTRIDALAFGVCAAILYREVLRQSDTPGRLIEAVRRVLSHDAAFVAAIALYVLSLVVRQPDFRETFRYTMQSIAAAELILYGFLASSTFLRKQFATVSGWAVVRYIGLASYSIYLVHLSLDKALDGPTQGWPSVAAVAVKIVAGVGAGLLVWLVVERPVERFKNRKRNPPRHALVGKRLEKAGT